MKRLALLLIISAGHLINLTGQPDIDSLIQELDRSLHDTTRLRLLGEISNYFRTRDYDSAVHYLEEYVFLAEETRDLPAMAEAYYFHAGALSNLGYINSAILFFEQASELYSELGDSGGLAKVFNGYGRMYLGEKEYEEALHHFNLSNEIFISLGEMRYEPYLLQNIGNCHYYLGDYERAIRYHLRALQLLHQSGDTSRVMVSALLNIGENYELSGKPDLAYDYYSRGLNLGVKLDILPRISDAHHLLARYYNGVGQYRMARLHSDSAWAIAETEGLVMKMREQSLLYSEILENLGEYRSALYYAGKYNELSEMIRQQEANKQLVRVWMDREISRITRENAIALNKVKLTRNFAFWAFVLILITLVFIYRSYRNKQKANAILAEMDELKSRMFSNISHELRTPLTLILDPIEQMVEDDRQKRPNERTLKSMQRNAQKILGLVNQMLELSRLDAGRLKIDLSKAGIINHIRVIAASFNSLAEKMDIHYSTSYPDSEYETWFDIDKLDKILTNLLSNAFKFTPAGGSVSINVSVKDGGKKLPGSRHAENWLYVSVHDTGRGIPEDDLPKIFNRFYQVGDKDDPGLIGTGIGLALTKELTDLLKGEISAESKLGHGTHINLAIPLGRGHLGESEYTLVENGAREIVREGVPVEDEPEYAPGEFMEDQPIIMVVDDSEDIRVHVRDNTPGYNVLEAENGEAGLNKAFESIPDLVITDLRMPAMDGIELCRRLKEDERTSHIPVIMLTAKSSVESRLEGLETGADDYLTKPFNSKELMVRVQNLITQRQRLRELYRKEFLLEPAAYTVESADEKFLNRTREIIEEQLSDPELSVEELGRAMSMSRMQLFRKIKSLTDQSPSEYIRTIRLKRAAQLIRSEYGNLAQITYEVGFNHPSYFAKCFRELYGVAPSEYGKN